MSSNFQRVVSPGVTPRGRLFVTIKYADGRLSLCGVEGPKSNGNASGSCGQCGVALDVTPNDAEGWTAESVARLAEIWERWHLNDMRAGCEHQRATWNPLEPLEIVAYGLTTEAHRLRTLAIERSVGAARAGSVADLDATDKALLAPNWHKELHVAPDADSPLSGCYEVKKSVRQTAGFTRPDEHPRGLLMKPCEICGYKYGSAWLREDAPAKVLAYLESLNETERSLPAAWANPC